MHRIAIVGAGMIAEYHRGAVEANAAHGAELAAMVHHDPAQFARIEAAFGAPCRLLDDVLADPTIGIVTLCTPSGQHAFQAQACVEAGKHVLVEKPMALSLTSADALIEAAEARGVRLAVALQRRVDPLFRRIKQAIDAGDLGALTLAAVTLPYFRGQAYYDQAAWRGTWALDGGGVLMNQGIHIVDLLVWFMGDPVSIQAEARTLHRDIEVEDVASAILRFENGALATLAATTTAGAGFPHRLEIYGTNGGIQVEGEGVVRWSLADPASARVEPPDLSSGASMSTSAGAGGDPRAITTAGHTAILADLIAAIEEGRNPHIDGREGRRSLAVILGIYEAAGLI
ncbi:MAG: Gfo/Idh/MocA family oxidoreductase [Rhodothermales bacterium]|nr:Gfo/Idh/MocA family oxidoreductase [Rhodothermales bacterium]